MSRGIPLPEALAAFRSVRSDRDVVVTTMGPARDWMAGGAPHPLDFVLVPSSMGQATSLGLGLALARPDRRVVVFNGDGSMLMNLGSLVTITAEAPANLIVVVCDNGAYEVTGAQPTPGSAAGRVGGDPIDYTALASAAGFRSVHRFSRLADWEEHLITVLSGPGPTFVALDTIPVPGGKGPRSPGPAPDRARRFMAALAAPVLALALGAGALVAQPAERVAPVRVAGSVFVDRNGNGARDPGEPGLAGVAVSDQISVTRTDGDGRFAMAAAGYGLVFVAQPDGYQVRGPFWKAATGGSVDFPLVPSVAGGAFTFIHASDTHVSEASVARIRRLRAMVDSLKPAFVLISGDLVRDALRVPEAEARGYYQLFEREIAAFPVPVYPVPGNHEIFGIERHKSLISERHPSYGKRLYRSFFGPNYYSFTVGGVHFVGLDTVDYFDLWYFGHVDAAQLEWLGRDLAALDRATPVVTFNHIPLVSGVPAIDGIDEESVAPSLIRLGGRTQLRHVVQGNDSVLAVLGPKLEIALGGHFHRREFLRYETMAGTRRFAQTAAVTGPVRGEGPLGIRSGITLYRVADRRVDDGTFIPLDP